MTTKAKKKTPATARNKRVRNAKRARRMKKKAIQVQSSVPTEKNTTGGARDALPPKQVMPTALPRMPKMMPKLPSMPKIELPELPAIPGPLKTARKVAKKGARLLRKAARKAKAKVGSRRAKKAAKKSG